MDCYEVFGGCFYYVFDVFVVGEVELFGGFFGGYWDRQFDQCVVQLHVFGALD